MDKSELAPDFIQNIDWELLKEQKFALLDLGKELEEESKQVKGDGWEELGKLKDSRVKAIDSIINLIDAIQDYAVDFLEIPEETVFNTEIED